MRIIQTADIHLDRSYAAMELPPNQGTECRRHLLDTLKVILDRAAAWPAHAVVICGDLFEHERVTRTTLKQLREAFAAVAPVRVFICPGRHDACQSGSPYLTEAWPDNVHCFQKPVWEAIPIDGYPVTFHGFGWDRSDLEGTLPEGLQSTDDGRMHLGFGFGLAAKVIQGTQSEPARFESAVVLPEGLDYLGLGELHAGRRIEGDFPMPVWYAGAPTDHGYASTGPHHYLEIEVGDVGDPIVVNPRTASERRFASISLDCSDLDSGQMLIDAVRRELESHKGVQFLRLSLEGQMPRPIYDEMEGIRETLSDAVQHLQWRDSCQLAEDYSAIESEHTSLGAFVARIGAEIQDAPTHAMRMQRARSRDLGLCAYRDTELPVHGMAGDYR